jgi:lysine 2,3-aminomutase
MNTDMLQVPAAPAAISASSQWRDWRWQLRHSIRSPGQLAEVLAVNERDLAPPGNAAGFSIGITPYYLQLIDRSNPDCPIRKSVVPSVLESAVSPSELPDPLSEDRYRPVPAIVHRYHNRCLFMVTGRCAVYCRYCTRSRLVGDPEKLQTTRKNWDQGLAYIASRPQITDVVLSGGDPLTLSDDDLDYILTGLRRISHVRLIRIGTKIPVVLPYRVTPDLVRLVAAHNPVWWSIHVTHPKELTVEAREAMTMIADAGMPMGSQTVLLNGVNDDKETMHDLMSELLWLRVRPYYLYQCDPIPGSGHFRTSEARGAEIMRHLKERLGGYALPRYVQDLPGPEGKQEIGY